jgi:hypothetical protein
VLQHVCNPALTGGISQPPAKFRILAGLYYDMTSGPAYPAVSLLQSCRCDLCASASSNSSQTQSPLCSSARTKTLHSPAHLHQRRCLCDGTSGQARAHSLVQSCERASRNVLRKQHDGCVLGLDSRKLLRSERAQPHQPRLRERRLREALTYPGTQGAGNYSIGELPRHGSRAFLAARTAVQQLL